MHGPNVVRVIVTPGAAHTPGTDVVGNQVTVVGELLLANTANPVLGDDLPVEQLSHFPVRAQFPVSAGVVRGVDAADTHLKLTSFFRDYLPAAAGLGAVYGTELMATESHGILPVGQMANDGLRLKQD